MSAGNSAAFGQAGNSNPFGSASVFGQRSNPDNGNPFAQGSFGTSTPFSTSTGASMFSGNSSGVLGLNAGFGSKTLTPSAPSFSSFGATSASSSGEAFGHSSATGASNSFGSTLSAFSSTPAPSASGSAIGVSGTPTFGTSSSFNFVASKTNNHESFNSRSIFGQPFSASYRNSVFGITAGPQTTPTIGSIKSGPSDISSGGSKVALNVATRADGSPGVAAGKVSSISTMTIDQDKNYEELRFEHYQLSHNKALTSSAPVGPAIVTLHSEPQTSTAVSTGPGLWGIIPSATPSLSTLQCQPQTSSATSTQLGPWGNFPSSSLSTFTFQSPPQASSATLTGTGTWGNASSSKLSPFTFHSQPQASRATSTGSEPWGNFPSSTQSIFTFQCQPQTSSATSTGIRHGDNFPLSTQSTFTFQSQPQTSSETSTGTEPWGNFSQGAQSIFTLQSLPQTSSAMSTVTGPRGQFPSSKAPLFTSHSQTRTSSSVPTGPGAWGMLPSSTTSLSQTTTPTAFTWTKPEHAAAPQKAQTAPAAHAIANKILEQPSKETLKSETDNLSTDMQQSSQSTITIKPFAVASPFGVQSTFQTSVDSPISSTSGQRGISRIPVADNPAPVKRFSMLTARNLTLGRSKLSFEKYRPTNDGQKVPFYEEKLPGICRVTASIIPRQNPRAWVLNPMEEGVLKAKSINSSLLEEKSSEFETGNSNDCGTGKDGSGSSAKCKLNSKVPFDSTSTQDEKFHAIQRNQTDKVATPYNFAAGVEAMMPKMQSLDYYIDPPIQELVAKERVEPGFCCHVKDFVVGRKGYGSIKFLGETDVRNLDLESLIKFNYREVIVYSDESKKPQVGQGLNKPAEVTLLNVKCIEKDTGKQYVDGPKVDKWRKLLIEKAAKQGVEFVSYDPVTGEWKFRVQHF